MFVVVVAVTLLALANAKSTKIVGGAPVTEEGKWPWQGALLFASSGSLTCGCVLASDRYALTAAHCVGSGASAYLARFGTLDRTVANPLYDRLLASVVAHADFENNGNIGFPNDIAILEFTSRINLNPDLVFPANLPGMDDGTRPDFTASLCRITGWGRLTGGGTLPTILQEAETFVMTETACAAAWGSQRINRMHICIKHPQEATGSCNGDSGGPLVCSDDGGRSFILAGLTSWGVSGCGTNYPSVYTRVSYHRQWIRDNADISL